MLFLLTMQAKGVVTMPANQLHLAFRLGLFAFIVIAANLAAYFGGAS